MQSVSFSRGGETGNTLTLGAGFGSGAYRHQSDAANTFYSISDRGPNIKCSDAAELIGLDNFCVRDNQSVSGKIFPVTDFAPSIYQWSLVENSAGQKQARIDKVIHLKDKDGNSLTGLPNPLTFVDGSINSEWAFDAAGNVLDFDSAGLDPEALVKLSDGTFWIAEEYGPSLLHIAADGRVIQRVVPQGVEAQLADANYPVVGGLPNVYHKRKLNRGIESIAVSPDEDYLYFIMQSPLNNPDYSRSRFVRLMKYHLNNGELGAAAGEYVYTLDQATTFGDGESGDNGKKMKDVKISEMLAVAKDELIVLERISKTTKLYRIHLDSATNILSSELSANGAQAKENNALKSLEDLYSLGNAGTKAVHKSLVFNSLNDPDSFGKKLEGMALLSDRHLMLINDNDFAIEGTETSVKVIDLADNLWTSSKVVKAAPQLSLVGRYKASTTGEGAAEIVQYHQASKKVFAINGDAGNRIELVDLSTMTDTPLASPLTNTNLQGKTIDLPAAVLIDGQAVNVSDINSIAIHNNILAVAIAHEHKVAQAGAVLVYALQANGEFDPADYKAVRVGVLPDNLTFTPDGTKLVVANEGEAPDLPADDQKGSISIIDMAGGQPAGDAVTLTFDAFNAEAIFGINQNPDAIDFAHAAEPEYVAVSADSKMAYVTLQEINGLAMVDLVNKQIVDVKGLGYKDHSLEANALDASDKDDKVNIRNYEHLYGLYQPDTIVSYSVAGKTYLVTANEGDAGDGFQDVDERVEDLALDPAVFTDAASFKPTMPWAA